MSEAAVAAAPAVVPPSVSAPAETPTATAVVVPPVQPATPGEPAKAIAPAQGAPEKYADFKADGLALNVEAVSAWDATAKASGLTQEQRDSAIKFQTEFFKAEIAKHEAKLEADFASRNALTANDPVLGGPDTVSKVANAQRAMAAFGNDPDLKAALESKETPTGHYLAFMRFAAKVGAAIKEDSSAGTNGAGSTAEKRGADVLFGAKT